MSILTRDRPDYTGTRNWDVKSQQIMYTGKDTDVVAQYRADAAERVRAYREALDDIASKLGFPIKIIEPHTKTEESSLRKVWDRNAKNSYGNPENITDYLRASIKVPAGPNGVKNLRHVLDVLIAHPDTIAYKDKFFRPENETGHRSFNALFNVNGHTAELKVDYEGMDAANDLTEGLRRFERRLKEAEVDIPARCSDTNQGGRWPSKLTSKMEDMITTVRQLRRQSHEVYAGACGLDALLDPKLREANVLTPEFTQQSMRRMLKDNPFGRGLTTLMPKLTDVLERKGLRLH